MGRKVNPKIFRIPMIREWESKWFASERKFRYFLEQDTKIRKFLSGKLKNCGISIVNIEILANVMRIIIHTAKPGLIIGRGGLDVEDIKKEIKKRFLSDNFVLEINVIEEKFPMLSAAVVLEGAIIDLEKRLPYRRVMKKVIKQVKAGGAKGCKIVVKGRLDGSEIARPEKLIWGQLPLHTLRADIDYSRGKAATIYGSVGVKVWIYRGERFENKSKKNKSDI